MSIPRVEESALFNDQVNVLTRVTASEELDPCNVVVHPEGDQNIGRTGKANDVVSLGRSLHHKAEKFSRRIDNLLSTTLRVEHSSFDSLREDVAKNVEADRLPYPGCLMGEKPLVLLSHKQQDGGEDAQANCVKQYRQNWPPRSRAKRLVANDR